jgi:hypothetical protein
MYVRRQLGKDRIGALEQLQAFVDSERRERSGITLDEIRSA